MAAAVPDWDGDGDPREFCYRVLFKRNTVQENYTEEGVRALWSLSVINDELKYAIAQHGALQPLVDIRQGGRARADALLHRKVAERRAGVADEHARGERELVLQGCTPNVVALCALLRLAVRPAHALAHGAVVGDV